MFFYTLHQACIFGLEAPSCRLFGSGATGSDNTKVMEPSCGLEAESTNWCNDPRSGLFGVVHGARGFPRKPLSLGAWGFGTVGLGGWSKTLVAGIL